MEKYQVYGDETNVQDNNDIELTSINNKILIQIIDVSDKTLIEEIRHKELLNEIQFNEVKKKQSFLEIINAAVSHELRNPLNSIITQKNLLNQLLDHLRNLFDKITIEDQGLK